MELGLTQIEVCRKVKIKLQFQEILLSYHCWTESLEKRNSNQTLIIITKSRPNSILVSSYGERRQS